MYGNPSQTQAWKRLSHHNILATESSYVRKCSNGHENEQNQGSLEVHRALVIPDKSDLSYI